MNRFVVTVGFKPKRGRWRYSASIHSIFEGSNIRAEDER
jgi:hypothetical protein